jgi:hypothetical protein
MADHLSGVAAAAVLVDHTARHLRLSLVEQAGDQVPMSARAAALLARTVPPRLPVVRAAAVTLDVRVTEAVGAEHRLQHR